MMTAATKRKPPIKTRGSRPALADDPLWYKDAVIYEIHVRAFADDDGDGIGDFRGLTKKLDYLQELGVTALWLLPFYPSPLRDDGYDIADYNQINPIFGTLKDFERFMSAAHKRGIRVVTELVINHTSDQHKWFQEARRAKPGSKARDFYVWSDTPHKYEDTRIIFRDFEPSNWSWDPVAQAYYWHRFYSHQPDLNFDNPAVRKAVKQAMDFWFDMGVDGMRLDAIPYLYEREGTDCENLPETHKFLKELRSHLDKNHKNRMFLAEANQWPEDAAEYFGDGDECHLNFHFPLMPRLFMSVQMEDRFPIIDILEQTPDIHPTSQWALFLRNHDELTLEMVTDEERDYMYRVYAHDKQARINLGIRRRLAPLLGNNRRRIELMNGLLFSLPGTPVLYYGDELGMGDNIYLGDRDGVRTPMQWSADRNAGFSRGNPQQLYMPVIIDPEYHYETVNVETQLGNTSSLLWWMKRIIALRQRFTAFGRGTIEFLLPENRKVLAYVREHEGEVILVVANLSRFAQYAELDLSRYKGRRMVELFGRTEFPVASDQPFTVTLGPHSFYWLQLEENSAATRGSRTLPSFTVGKSWSEVLQGRMRDDLESKLGAYIKDRRWFAGKAKGLGDVEITDEIEVAMGRRSARLCFIEVGYTDAQPETYLLPLTAVEGTRGKEIADQSPHAIVARLQHKDRDTEHGYLVDAAYDPAFSAALLETITKRRRLKGSRGEAAGTRTKVFGELWDGKSPLEPHVGKAEQSNTSIVFGEEFILKLYRRIEEGTNPDLEIGHFLQEAKFEHTPRVAGALTYKRSTKKATEHALGFLQGYVPNEGDAWKYTVDEVELYLERAASEGPPGPQNDLAPNLIEQSDETLPQQLHDLIGGYLESARLLAQRTAEMHVALASGDRGSASAGSKTDFKPESFTPFYRRSLYQSMRNLTQRVFSQAKKRRGDLPADMRSELDDLLTLEKPVTRWFQKTLEANIKATRIRTHGDYHLGQVLYTGRDFVIIDFEGEPSRSLEERRLKRNPLRDVAGMLRSLHYASHTALYARNRRVHTSPESMAALEQWAALWHQGVSAQFLQGYLAVAEEASLLAKLSWEDVGLLLDMYRLEKVIYELGYELNNRPEWVNIPMAGLRQITRGLGIES